MPALSVMIKTVSTDCNLDCSYCYYRESLEGARVRRRMENGLIERFIPAYLEYVSDVRLASLAWQGGEPTLAGLPFFQRVVDIEQRNAARGTIVGNALQTNGVLLNDDWGAFLRQFNWLVGVSLDGPRKIHDTLRRDRGGAGSFDRVMRGIDVLRRHRVDFNVLCVLGPHNIAQPAELMRFFRGEGFSHVQLIPAMDFQAIEPEKPPSYLISPAAYGRFLSEAFDVWYEDGAPTVSVRTFDNFLQSHLGIPNDLCVHGDRCDAGIVVEWDGSAYPCDFYIHPGWKLGNVLEQPLANLIEGPARRAFVAQKRPLPADCQQCEWLSVCKSGCPRNRSATADGTEPDYFCAAYKRFFAHADQRLTQLGRAVHNRWRYLDALEMAPQAARRLGPNDPCPCGSGLKHKRCCGRRQADQSYVLGGRRRQADPISSGRRAS